jgi:SM-20-related protein
MLGGQIAALMEPVIPDEPMRSIQKERAMDELLDFKALNAVNAATEPFDYFVATGLLAPKTLEHVIAEFPAAPVSGLLPSSSLELSPVLAKLADELRGPKMTALLSEKFNINLSGRPTMVSVRSKAAAKDGRIHTDSENKVASVLFYLNPSWTAEGGRLRLLKSPDLEDYAVEVVPEAGTLVAFRRCEYSWHGHKPHVGDRRYLMVNWMADAATAALEETRHRVTAGLKRVFA